MDDKENIKKIVNRLMEEIKLGNIIQHTHVNFLFGAGINGKLFPQLNDLETFVLTTKYLNENSINIDNSKSFEENIDFLTNEKNRDEIKKTFIKDIENFNKIAIEKIESKNDIDDFILLNNLIININILIKNSENVLKTRKSINVFTLNYDSIIDKSLLSTVIDFNIYTLDNISKKNHLINCLTYDYSIDIFLPRWNVFKIHGDISDKDVTLPTHEKLNKIINSQESFELFFQMKQSMVKESSLLIIIGYSLKDSHINETISSLLKKGLSCVYFAFDEIDIDNYNKIFKNNNLIHLIECNKTCPKKILVNFLEKVLLSKYEESK